MKRPNDGRFFILKNLYHPKNHVTLTILHTFNYMKTNEGEKEMKKLFTILLTAVALFTFSIGASAQTTSGDLTSSKAIKLALSAREHYWSVMNGHNLKAKNSTCTSKTFTYKGTDYRYFCSEFNTKAKLVKYENEIFTLNAIEKGIKKYHFIIYKGKLAQPNADGGSLLEWDKAKAKLVYKKNDVRLYQFTVPYGEKVEYDKRNVTFVKVRGHWQINAVDAVK
jgi:iseA protein